MVAERATARSALVRSPPDERTDLVIRATDNRGLVGGSNLEQAAERVTCYGSRQGEIPGNRLRAARTATVQIGWATLQLTPPQDYPRPASAPRPLLQTE